MPVPAPVSRGSVEAIARLLESVRFTDDGEMWTTETERESNVFVNLSGSQTTAATRYYGLIDLSDTTNWPHTETGAIHLSFIRFATDKANAARGSVALGVIVRIDGTSADISYVGNLSFIEADNNSVTESVNLAPTQLKCNVVGGRLAFFKASVTETNVTAVNTANPMPFGYTFTPAVGDLVMRIQTTTGGNLNWVVGLAYHAHPTP